MEERRGTEMFNSLIDVNWITVHPNDQNTTRSLKVLKE